MSITKISILGATGSIGQQALQVVRENPNRLKVSVLTAHSNIEALTRLAKEFQPAVVAIREDKLFLPLKKALSSYPIEVVAGEEGLIAAAAYNETDLVLSSLVGIAGLKPTIAAIKAGKTIALANKEVLVAGGSYVMSEAKKQGVTIIPVDSEHSAIYQCLQGESETPETLWITASGGPFLHHTKEELMEVTPEQALKHPRWKMGKKVTIDSATLANKGFEVIEAHWLFDMPASKIKVVVHPQSIVHSLVCFEDGSMKAQLAQPDMRLPIALALGLGKRIPNKYPRLNLYDQSFSFSQPSFDRFPMLSYAYEALQKGGNSTAILNAADSVAVKAFLEKRISFLDIPRVAEAMLSRDFYEEGVDLATIVETDERVTREAEDFLSTL